MRKDQILKTWLVVVFVMLGILPGYVFADIVVLKNGNIIEGEVTEKNDNYLAIIIPENKGVKTYYLADRVDKVNGQLFNQFQVKKNKVVSQKFYPKHGQKTPVVSLTLKDGRTIKGKLVDRNDQYFRLIQEGADRPEEFLIENIVKAE